VRYSITFDEKGCYHTGEVHPGLLHRMMPSLFFYLPCLKTVVCASRLAKRGGYGDQEWFDDSAGMLHFLEQVGVKVEITGIEYLRAVDGPCVVAANHMSTLETFVLPSVVGSVTPVTFIVKKSLTTYPVFGHIMRSRDPVTVGRENPREDLRAVLEGGAERLAGGRSIVVFPQTTRSLEFSPATFNSIGVKLAKRAGVPVVPLALRTDAWGNGKFVKDLGPIHPEIPVTFAFGEPIMVEGRGDAEHRRVVEFISTHLAQWGAAVAD